MKITARNLANAGFIGLGVVVLIIDFTHPGQAQSRPRPAIQITNEKLPVAQPTAGNSQTVKPGAGAPSIITDTTSSSPDTNLVGNLVIFTAEVGGTPPVARQWKVDKGAGFIDVSASATNSWLGITNAQVSDTGNYALFATNSTGGIHTTPHAITLIDGVD